MDAARYCQPMCAEREAAIRRGEFGYRARFGWVFLTGRRPRKRNGAPFSWSECPWCQALLLPPGVSVERYREAQREGDIDDEC